MKEIKGEEVKFKPKKPPVFSAKARAIKPGAYRHYKGGTYDVLGVAYHSDTGRELVVYRARYGARTLFVRSVVVFLQSVERGGKRAARFEKIKNEK